MVSLPALTAGGGLMKTTRRRFISCSTAATLATMGACRSTPLRTDFPVHMDASLLRGHTLFEGPPLTQASKVERKQILIVGSGIAGMAAACELSDFETIVCEVGDRLGGSSSSYQDESGAIFAQGAHYELPFPENYGKEGLAFLEKRNIIHWNSHAHMWEFTDTQYLIDYDLESRTWDGNGWRHDPIPYQETGQRFVQAIAEFEGKLPMPTTLIAKEYHRLNTITFAQWLDDKGLTDVTFRVGIDYQMRDDYGAGADTVSALAGLHYYQCRPYYTRDMKHFSPPEGNGYFVDKMHSQLPEGTCQPNHLVTQIRPQNQQFLVDVADLTNHKMRQFRVDGIVYAGQKHALKYTYAQDAPLFANNRYAPWLTVALAVKGFRGPHYWQNEVVGQDKAFLGFVNSGSQYGAGETIVLTCYLCLAEADRVQLIHAGKQPQPWIERALAMVNGALDTRIDQHVQRAHIKLHGHAMPIPIPNYLFKDGNHQRSQPRLVYAGVDNGRLPLFFEALDSGIQAAKLLKKQLTN